MAKGLIGKIGEWLRGKNPTPSKVEGHRGIAAGSIANPNLDQYAQRLAAGHAGISGGEVEEFMSGGYPLFVMSSNVAFFQYYPETEQLQVEYLSGGAYLYEGVTPDEAMRMATAQSKGAAVWDILRVRGSRTAHRKAYSRLR